MTSAPPPLPGAEAVGGSSPQGAPAAALHPLVARMSLEEKLAQLVGVWAGYRDPEEPGDGPAPPGGADAGPVAPLDDQQRSADVDRASSHGLGQLSRWYGTRPVDPLLARERLREVQRAAAERSGHGIGVVVHEECLTGALAHGATVFPCPLAWGAAWDQGLVEEVGAAIGSTLAALDVHQGLAPVLDVAHDARWGRVEECIAEDPLLVAVLGTAYVRGLESSGVVATPKHFAGHSASTGGRNMAPVSLGRGELHDVYLPPFLMAIREGGARSVMHAYASVDGVPAAADSWLLTELLRDAWGFTGTVVADYSAVSLLARLHGVAGDLGAAAVLALTAGIDVELPTGEAYLEPLAEAIRSGQADEALVDRAVDRVLRQKEQLGLVGAGPRPVDGSDGSLDLDPAHHRGLARRLAERSVVLLHNPGPEPVLPLPPTGRVAVVGAVADDPYALLGSYAFPNHVGRAHPGVPLGISVPTVLDALRRELDGCQVEYSPGASPLGRAEDGGIPAAVDLARAADLCVAVIGDRPGLFGRGTVGEGCDSETLAVPGDQRDLVEAVLDTGTPVVVVLLTGRPYVLDWLLPRAAAIVQAFLPGEEGAAAVAGVLSGRVEPSGRLPVSLPRSVGVQPSTYRRPVAAGPGFTTSLDPTPVFPFGHGLGYGRVGWGPLEPASHTVPTDGVVVVEVSLENQADRARGEVVQLYARDLVRSVVPPETQLVAWQRLELGPGERASLRFHVPTELFGFTDRTGLHRVEAGAVRLLLGRSSADVVDQCDVVLTGPDLALGVDRRLAAWTEVVRPRAAAHDSLPPRGGPAQAAGGD